MLNETFQANLNTVKSSRINYSFFLFLAIRYANGPGGLLKIRRFNITNKVTEDGDFVQESAVFRKSETHGGEDVAIYASGPMSHLFTKTVEQSYIFHVMAYSSCKLDSQIHS